MSKKIKGNGGYTFLTLGKKNVVKKQAVWKTPRFFNNEWIVVAYNEVK